MDLESGNVPNPQFREPVEHSKPEEWINWPVRGVVVNVIPTNSPDNGQGQVLCDVDLVDHNYTLFRVPIYTPAFHQDTDPSGNQLARQTTARRPRNIYDGEAWSPSVGAICIVMFEGEPGPKRNAFISHFVPTSNQSLPHQDMKPGDNLFPQQAQAVTIFGPNGQPIEEFRSRLQPTESETPRWTRIQNGTAMEIDNRGNFNVQSTINRDPIKKERYRQYNYQQADTDTSLETPAPEGNVVVSTRGAKRGNIGLITGRVKTEKKTVNLNVRDGTVDRQMTITISEAMDEQNDEGNVLISTGGAKQGKVTVTTKESDDGTILLIDAAGTFIKLEAPGKNLKINAVSDMEAEVGGDTTVDTSGDTLIRSGGDIDIVVGGGVVRIGLAGASHAAVMGDILLQWILQEVMTHVHFGVESGNDTTGLPTITPPNILSKKVLVSD